MSTVRSQSSGLSAVDRARRTTLYRRLFRTYVALLVGALLVLVLAPVTISVPVTRGQLVWMLAGFALLLIVFNLYLKRLLGPLERLTALMKSIDPLAPGRRIEVEARAGMWVATLTQAFNRMLDRLEEERRASAHRALAVQEAERRRIARELNDEVGQVFTTMMLDSDTLARRAPEQLRPDIQELREAARQGAEDVRGIARRLRPEALDELGLQSALMALTDAVCERAGIAVTRHLEPGLPLTPEQELVIYRVAQESMTNVVRHSQAHRINVTLGGDGAGGVLLVVGDDGVGLPSGGDHDSTGLRGMRERALLVGAEIAIGAGPRGGTEVRLHLPSDELA